MIGGRRTNDGRAGDMDLFRFLALLVPLLLVIPSFLTVSTVLGAKGQGTGDASEENSSGQGEESGSEEMICGLMTYEALAQQAGTGSRYLAATGEHAYIFVDGGNPSQQEIDDLLSEFDDVIWPANTKVFGGINKERINIHIDTIDGRYGIGGYYIPGTWDIYVDAADLDSWGYEITAHEFQHLQHDKHDGNEDLWLNEAMSELSVHIIYGASAMSVSGHLDSYEAHPDNDLTVFENEMYDYGSAYAFAVYLWEHFGGNETIRAIVDEDSNGFRGILNVLSDLDPEWTYTDIELFSLWSMANLLDDSSAYGGEYGYETIDLMMATEGTIDNYPRQIQGSVVSWGNDYFILRNGDKRDLALNVSRLEGSFEFTIAGVGSAGVVVRSAKVTSDHPTAEITVPNFGASYMVAYLAVSGWEGERYMFNARLKDNTPPATVVVVDPETPDGQNGYFVTEPDIGFVTTETADTYYWWDDGQETIYCPDCQPPIVPHAPEGNHTLHFYSIDPEGNVEDETGSKNFLVDTVAPTAQADIDPSVPDGEDGWYVSSVTVELRTEENGTLFYRWDSGFYDEYDAPIVAPEGVHTLQYYSVDMAGNGGVVSKEEIRLDTVAPRVDIEVAPEAPDGRNGYYLTQPLVALYTNGSQDTIYYRIDEGPVLTYGKTFKIQQGEHRLHYWSKDKAGNEAVPEILSFKVDILVPVTQMDIDPASPDGEDGWYVSTPSVDFRTDPDADIYYRWGNGVERRFTGTLLMQQGVRDLYYWSVDGAGNVESTNHLEIKIDTEVPECTIRITGEERFGWFLEAPRIEFGFSDDANVYYRWDDGLETKYTIPITGKEGHHDLEYFVKDRAGNRGEVRSVSFDVDPIDPRATFVVSPIYARAGEELVFDASGSSDNIGLVSYEFDFGDGFVEELEDSEATRHIFQFPGDYTVALTVTDAAGRESVYEREVHIEAKAEEDEEGGISLSTMLLFLGLGILVVLLLVLAGGRRKRRRALDPYVDIYRERRGKTRKTGDKAKGTVGKRRKVEGNVRRKGKAKAKGTRSRPRKTGGTGKKGSPSRRTRKIVRKKGVRKARVSKGRKDSRSGKGRSRRRRASSGTRKGTGKKSG